MYFLTHIYVRKFFGPRELIDWSTNKVSICLFNTKFPVHKEADDKFLDFLIFNLANTVWWWQFRCKKEWRLYSMTRFDGDVYIKSIHENNLLLNGFVH